MGGWVEEEDGVFFLEGCAVHLHRLIHPPYKVMPRPCRKRLRRKQP